MNAPLISIVTTVRNGAATLPDTLASIRRQSFADFEYVVVAGASSDETVALLEASPVATRWISEADAGIFDAMNKGAAMARGRWLYFLGCDDTLCSDVLAEIAPRLLDTRTVYYGDVIPASNGQRYAGPFGPRKLAVRNICHQAIFYTRLVSERYPYDLNYKILADWVVNMQCFGDPELRKEYVPLVIARYEDRRGKSARHSDPAFIRDYPDLLRRHFPRRISAWRTTLALGGRTLRRLGIWSS